MYRAPYSMVGLSAVLALGTMACSDDAASPNRGGSCYESTYAAIQATIFDAKGCTQSPCHGDSAEGGLDLRAEASHAELVYVGSQIDESIQRVNPGEPDLSLLYRKLQAKAEGADLGPLGQAMPVGAEPLSDDELEAVRLWIRHGANADQIMGDSLKLLGCEESFDASPNKIQPLPPPDPGTGVQLYSGAWPLPAQSEDEVCFVTYYDFSDLVPEDALIACPQQFGGQQCFAFGDNELAQDGQSHHSIIDAYLVPSDPNGAEWGPWTCLGGQTNGEACDPTQRDACGARSQCSTAVLTSLTCNRYPNAPELFRGSPGGVGGVRTQFSGAQESRFIGDLIDGVYRILPVEGFIAWNSHAFNLTREDTTIEQWVNLSFRFADERKWPAEQIFDTSRIYAMSEVEPFSKKEICMTFTLPRYSRLLHLSSHMHSRGELFRIWLPPHEPCAEVAGCAVPTAPPEYESRIYDDPLYQYYPADDLPAFNDEAPNERTFKACAVYDNGADNPMEVKRHSTRPDAPTCSEPSAHCGCDAIDRVCLGGNAQGFACAGDDAACGDGICDACPLLGGVTTDDEMFIPLGAYYVESLE